MKVELVESLSTDARPEAWRLYTEVFDDLRFRAVQRQVMYRPEFDSVMTDRRVSKCLAQDDGGGLRGLSTFTNDLAAVPLISPEYFERRWPDRFAARRIWYCGFVAVRPGTEQQRRLRGAGGGDVPGGGAAGRHHRAGPLPARRPGAARSPGRCG